MARRPQAHTQLIGTRGAASAEHHRFLMGLTDDVTTLQAEQAARRIVAYGKLSAGYTLTSTTNWQRLFDWSANGRVRVDPGHYRFECMYRMTGMSATSGNAGFRLAGTATLAQIMRQNFGHEGANTSAQTTSGVLDITNETAFDIVTAGASQTLSAMHRGTFAVTAAGTIIPQVALTTAATPNVTAGSYFVLERLADDFTFGEWE
jgi:hypothetical protein